MERIKVIYIMGYGRSGSTVLDVLLHQHEKAHSVGALNNIFEWYLQNGTCGCGDKLIDCSFWKEFLEVSTINTEDFKRQLKLQSNIEGAMNFRRLLKGRIDMSEYNRLLKSIFRSVSLVSGSTCIIDSSKSTRDCAGRAYALYSLEDLDVRIIYLVRDIRGVCWSAIKKSGSPERNRFTNNKILNLYRTAISWLITNRFAQMTLESLPVGAVHLVKYEELCESPRRTMEEIGAFVGLDYSQVSEKVEGGADLAVSHNIGGNQIRFNKTLQFKADMKWKTEMPKIFQTLALSVAGHMNKKLGYSK